jgi:cell division septum initiation protein DivIVA
MVTAVRATNKVIWAMDEAIQEHDGEVAELLSELTNRLEREQVIARNRFDKAAQLRVSEAFLLIARLQGHAARLASLHRQARVNEYDRR